MVQQNTMKQRIQDDMLTAMKSRDKARLEALRLVKAKMMEAEVALRGKKGRDYTLEDSEAITVLSSCAKQRRDSIDSYKEAGRDDLAANEEAELAIIQEYLPRQLGDDEIERIVKEAIASTGAMSPRDIGAVMKIVMPMVKGAADGKAVNRIVSRQLGGK